MTHQPGTPVRLYIGPNIRPIYHLLRARAIVCSPDGHAESAVTKAAVGEESINQQAARREKASCTTRQETVGSANSKRPCCGGVAGELASAFDTNAQCGPCRVVAAAVTG